ncbi:MAG: hypothetical protein MJ172_11020 [Clostridia bacterium]|nr:hypothetical protein [Clostridia bacterium]
MKKTIILMIGSALAFVGMLLFFNGSLEQFPTDEQIGKVRIAGAIFLCLGLIINGSQILKRR